MVTTRTFASGYLSPKNASAPEASASSMFMMSVRISRSLRISSIHLLLDFGDFAGIDGGEVREIEAQMIGRDERAGLLHVRAENIAQRGVHQVRGRVVAHVARAALGIGDGGDAVADAQVFLGDDAVRDESGDRIIRAVHFGDFERFGIVVEAAGVRDLSAGFGIDRGAVEDDFGFRALLDFVYRALLGDDGFDAAIARRRAEVEVRLGLEGFRELRVGGIRRLPCARLSTRLLRASAAPSWRCSKPAPIDVDSACRGNILR